MSPLYENNLYERGRYGGDRPTNLDSEKAHEAYNSGRAQRERDRQSDEALQKLIDAFKPGK